VPAPGVRVRPGTRADRRAVGAVLGDAFQVEPVYAWLFPDPAQRRRRLGRLLRTVVERMHRDFGVVQVAELPERPGEVVGVALWDAPGAVGAGTSPALGALPGLLRATGRRMPELARLGAPFEAARPREPHWYLSHLGIAPAHQGRGVGGALLRAMPPVHDGRPAYLECRPALVPFYARYGFAVSGQVVVDPTLSATTMWRSAAPPA
jgi:GNAT superfamily N-acetyltransferase